MLYFFFIIFGVYLGINGSSRRINFIKLKSVYWFSVICIDWFTIKLGVGSYTQHQGQTKWTYFVTHDNTNRNILKIKTLLSLVWPVTDLEHLARLSPLSCLSRGYLTFWFDRILYSYSFIIWPLSSDRSLVFRLSVAEGSYELVKVKKKTDINFIESKGNKRKNG